MHDFAPFKAFQLYCRKKNVGSGILRTWKNAAGAGTEESG